MMMMNKAKKKKKNYSFNFRLVNQLNQRPPILSIAKIAVIVIGAVMNVITCKM